MLSTLGAEDKQVSQLISIVRAYLLTVRTFPRNFKLSKGPKSNWAGQSPWLPAANVENSGQICFQSSNSYSSELCEQSQLFSL